jgi:predicted outer membrane repeat protein
MDIFIYESQLPVIDVFVDTFTVMRPTDYYASPIDNFAFDILHSVEDSLINSDVYVSVEGDNSNNGTSPETPFKTIKYALSRIYSDIITTNTIHLATGIYSPTTNGESFPIKWSNYVNLSGSEEEETILDAENSGGVMEFLSVSDALIENLTITGGSAYDGGGIFCRDHSNPSFENVVIINNSAVYDGGGIYCNDYSNPSLDNVELSGNSSNSGGGIFCNGNSNPSLENVTIADNTAEYHGGGILCRYSSPSLENVTITGNSANGNYYGGGGIYCSQGSSPSLENVTISDNFALSGGGIGCRSNSNPSLENVTISDNSAIYGGGIFCCVNSNPSLVNVTITGNSANAGGGIYCNDSSPSLINVTISSNTAIYSNGGGILCDDNSNPSLTNCIMWNDSPEEIYIESGSVTATYSDIQGGWAGSGNINEDPLFVGTGADPYSLLEDSPCIDAGIPDTTGLNLPPWDIIGNLRIWDGDGNGTAIIDMGAYEYGSPPYVDVDDNIVVHTPEVFLHQNYPNPFNPITTISFDIKENETGILTIFNIKGQLIESHRFESGKHNYLWDASEQSSGIYLYKLHTESITETRKMLLLK